MKDPQRAQDEGRKTRVKGKFPGRRGGKELNTHIREDQKSRMMLGEQCEDENKLAAKHHQRGGKGSVP